VLWLAFVVFRKVALADRRPVPYWRKLWQPFGNAPWPDRQGRQGRPPDRTAQLARDFALLGAMPLLIMGIAQEALSNVARHARATKVQVTVEQMGGKVRVVVADDTPCYATACNSCCQRNPTWKWSAQRGMGARQCARWSNFGPTWW
jgi:hypothetical protein